MNMRLLFWLCLSVVSAVLTTSALPQQRAARVALVIGNDSYPDASTPLSTTIKDARTLAEEFRRSEFEVDLKENVGKEDMQRAVDAFMGKIRPGTVALFYFSGYGIQSRARPTSFRSMPKCGRKPRCVATGSASTHYWRR